MIAEFVWPASTNLALTGAIRIMQGNLLEIGGQPAYCAFTCQLNSIGDLMVEAAGVYSEEIPDETPVPPAVIEAMEAVMASHYYPVIAAADQTAAEIAPAATE
jgi:hypothetical protein